MNARTHRLTLIGPSYADTPRVGPDRKFRKIAAVALMLAAALAPITASAESRSATMQVSVTVVARAIVNVYQQPQDVLITSDDLRRGYVEISTPFLVNVRTNCRTGYLLRMVNTDPLFASAEISTTDFAMHVLAESIITRPYSPAGDTLDLKVRLVLASGAREGRYSFPVVVDASPLG
jgi:hypothetical protein